MATTYTGCYVCCGVEVTNCCSNTVPTTLYLNVIDFPVLPVGTTRSFTITLTYNSGTGKWEGSYFVDCGNSSGITFTLSFTLECSATVGWLLSLVGGGIGCGDNAWSQTGLDLDEDSCDPLQLSDNSNTFIGTCASCANRFTFTITE